MGRSESIYKTTTLRKNIEHEYASQFFEIGTIILADVIAAITDKNNYPDQCVDMRLDKAFHHGYYKEMVSLI